MATYFLEAKTQPGEPGYTDKPKTINLGHRSWTLQPRNEYHGRRVFEVDDESTFNQLLRNYPSLTVARDLATEHESAVVERAVARVVGPIIARLEALENKNNKRKRAPDT